MRAHGVHFTLIAAVLCAAAAARAQPQSGAEQNAARPLPTLTCPLETAEFHPCALERAKTFEPARLPDGRPDLRGYWRAQHNGAAYDIEPNPGGFAVPATKGIIVDTPDKKIPYRPEALARRDELRKDGFLDPQAHCAPSGAPRRNFTNFGWQIIQPKDHVLFIYESMHDYRVIPTDGRAHLPPSFKLWHGDPIGHWEGDTLVVDHTNMNGRNWLDMSGNFQTENSHVVERYTLIDANTIHFEARIEDPTIYTRPFTIVIPFTRNVEQGYYQLEYACHEGERDLQHIDAAPQ
jgi:hypothetical protein